MNNWNRIFKPIVVLGVICVIVTGALAATNGVTAPIIQAATEAAETAARTELLPEADSFTEVKDVAVENVSGISRSRLRPRASAATWSPARSTGRITPVCPRRRRWS